MKNWKTTLAGIIIAGVAFAVHMGYITVEAGGAIISFATALGLITASDAKPTKTENANKSESIPYPDGKPTKRP